VRLPTGRTRLVDVRASSEWISTLKQRINDLEGIPVGVQRLVLGSKELAGCAAVEPLQDCIVQLQLRLVGGGGDGDQPDWTERGKVSTTGKVRRGPEARAPDWHADTAKYAAKIERDKRERGELVVAVGPFCVPCGKRFAKQTVYDAHLSGSKHLKALERLGRTEEAMVCKLDVEAKRRKIAEKEAERDAEHMLGQAKVQAAVEAPPDESEIERRAAREQKLRERAMLPMPAAVSAASVYDSDLTPDAAAKPAPAEPPSVPAADPAISALEMAATASGVTGAFTGEQKVNRFTSADKAAVHRSLAVAPDDWFGSGIHSTEPAVPEAPQ